MAFPRINCRTTTAAVLTATATVTLCIVCVCASFCPISYHKSIGDRSSSATSSRRRSAGRSRRFAAASRRSGRSARRAGPREARFVISQDSHIDIFLFVVVVVLSAYVNRQSLRRSVDGCGGAGRRTLQVRMCCSISCLVRHVTRKVFSFLHAREQVFFFLILGLHTVLLSSSTCTCSFGTLSRRIRQEVLLQCSRRQVCMVHSIVAITGAHRTPDLPLAAAVALWLCRASGSLCKSRTSCKTVALFTLFDRLQL